ncbi:MAG TPA: polymer-forming cytoskeletal protein [Symbiobacteriaceae bacterium]|nr:polymer-forming cytoskeletal protein [Symbiobacteriaceae bacterium]
MWPWLKRRVTGPSVIGPHVCIRGQIESAGDLTIYGCVKGDIVHTGHLELAGVVEGNVQVEGTLVLQSTAHLNGDTRCSSLEVKQGAVFTGANRMADTPIPAVAMAVSPPEPVPAPLEILMEPVGRAEKEVLGVATKPVVESPAFYGGFSPAVR